MDADWIKSPSARRILVHWADPRPAWLWSGDGARLLWRNGAAKFFAGKIKKSGVKVAPGAVPIRGQVARLIRLGSPGRSSLSRIQFLAGEKPVSTTCTCTPVALFSGQTGLLIVGVDAIEPELLETAERTDPATETLFPSGTDYLLADDDGLIAGGSRTALDELAPLLEAGGLPGLGAGENGKIEVGDRVVTVTRLKASPGNASLLLFEAAGDVALTMAEKPPLTAAEVPASPPYEAATDEPMLPMGLPPVAGFDPAAREGEYTVDPAGIADEVQDRALSSLFDRLAEDAELYTSLEDLPSPAAELDSAVLKDFEPEETGDQLREDFEEDAPPAVAEQAEPVAAPGMETDDIAAIIAFDEADEPDAPNGEPAEPVRPVEEPVPYMDVADPDGARPVLYKVTGRWFEPIVEELPAALPDIAAEAEVYTETIEPLAVEDPPLAPDIETVERVSRYNFDELSRILNDRVGADQAVPEPGPVVETLPAPRQRFAAQSQPEGQLVSLAGETFILNRLPLGILVFRDQQVLFANRSITEMIGYTSIEELRRAGLAAIFPTTGREGQEAGPVNHLVQRDGTLVPVTARLQSISWQGRPALMLSASATEVRTGHEAAVRAFAELLAETREDGFIEANRSGVISMSSAYAWVVLGRTEEQLVGKPLSALIEPSETKALQEFLERPARFAETARPCISLRGAEPDTALLLFAQGQAGVVTGYFGLVRRHDGRAAPLLAAPGDVEPSMLARVSRGVRRPLNTIIGFSDLIRSAAFGDVGNARYVEYAQDIKTAGQEIAALVDELDDYARLKDGRYAPRPAEVDLGALLESCIVRVRGQAGAARVLVRSAISEQLPRIRADRASLGQAVLNLLASAIDQTPAGGSVILSVVAWVHLVR